jgi:EAL domain-containing protein (putative c-di-GMP-specific phosphodiesterase class I)
VAFADRLRASVPQPCSAGVAEMREDDSRSMLVSRADVALYDAKNRGGNQTQQHDGAIDDEGPHTRKALSLGLAAGEFEVVYQPIVELSSGTIIGDEALARWRHPVHGVISPLEFIPSAERNGAIVELGRWVLRQACVDTARHIAQTGMQRRVSVNASVHELKRPDYAEHLALILAESAIEPANLIIEVTESTFDADNPQVLAVLHKLRELGVDVAIDDFGTGYSSLNRLNQLPVTMLKIDRTFISAIQDANADAPVLKAIVSLASALQLKITAEGVETIEQAELLYRLGCTHAQGYYYGRPRREIQSIRAVRPTDHGWGRSVSRSA